MALSSLIKCNVAMLATNPMPGKPSIRMGLFSVGFSVRCIVQTMVGFSCLWFVGFVGVIKSCVVGVRGKC